MEVFLITLFLITLIASVFMTHREIIKTKKLKEREEKKREEIIEDAKKKIKKMKEDTKQIKCLIELFNNSIILYNSNPSKFCAYKNELLEWYEKITLERSKFLEAIILNNDSDISFQKLLTSLKEFAKWTEGKIE